jgi:tetratricopeptide (TPR) repeat protein
MAEDLRRYVNRFAIQARRAGPIKRLRKWAKRRPGLATALAGLVIALAVAGFFAQQVWRERQERLASDAIARQKLLDEKMQEAQYEILQGDFSRAEETISAAEHLGATEEWALWRRGQIAFHREDYEEAIQLLRPAMARMQDNVALTCLFVKALQYAGGVPVELVAISGRLDSLSPRTPEDFLYKGYVETSFDPKALKTLDKAIERQPSLIGHVVRAQVRASHALDTSDLAGVERSRSGSLSVGRGARS